jgi:vitamin B12 transporter
MARSTRSTSEQSERFSTHWLAPSALLLAAVVGAAPALGQPEAGPPAGDTTAGEAAAHEEEITVWGERLEESLPENVADYGSRLETVSSEQVEAGSFIDVGQILGLVPGLYVSQQNGPFDYVNVSLLGSNRKEVLWLIDGVRISNRLYDTTPPLDTIPSSIVERVEVLKGGQGLFYGTQAVGGVINVVTKEVARSAGGQVSVGFDSDEGTHLNGTAQTGGEHQRFVIYGSDDDADGFQPFRDEDYQPSGTDRERGYEVTTFGARYRGAPNAKALFSAHWQHTDAQLDFAAPEDRAESFNERDEDVAWVKVDWLPTPELDLFVKAYWHDWDSNFTRIDNDLANPGQLITVSDRADWWFEDYGLNVLGEYDLGDRTHLLAGIDHQSYEGLDDEFLIGEQSETVNAAFAQVRLDLDVLAGARVALGARHNEPDDGGSKTVWDVSGEVGIDDGFYARGRIGTAFRLPSAYELYVIDPCCERGNPNLVAEESFNAEAAAGGRYERFTWEAMAFHRNVEDLIVIDFDLPDFPDGLIVNSDAEIEVDGFELTGTFDLTDTLAATLDYTYSDAAEKGSSDQLDDIPEDMAKLILDWRGDDLPLGAGIVVNYVGDVYDTAGGGLGRFQQGNYTTVDLAASYTFVERHRIGVRLVNALDEEYDTRILRVRRDVDGSSYAAGMLGVPRTLYGEYTFGF